MTNLKLQTSISKSMSEGQGPPNPPPPSKVRVGQDPPNNIFQPLYARPDKMENNTESLGNTPNYSPPSTTLLKVIEPLSSDTTMNVKQIDIPESTLGADQNELIEQTQPDYDFSTYNNLRGGGGPESSDTLIADSGGGLESSDTLIADIGHSSISASLFLPTLAMISTTITTSFVSGIGLAMGFFFTQQCIIPWLSSFRPSTK